MLDAAQEAMSFVAGRTREDLDRDRMLLLSLIKELEILGEAASRVSQATVAEHGGIPWREIIGMRHHLIHGYFDVDADLVWDTMTNDLPRLIDQLKLVLQS